MILTFGGSAATRVFAAISALFSDLTALRSRAEAADAHDAPPWFEYSPIVLEVARCVLTEKLPRYPPSLHPLPPRAFWGCKEGKREVSPLQTHPTHRQGPKTQNPKPKTQNPKPQTPNPKPQTPNPKPQTPNPKPQTPNPKPQTPNPKPQTSNPKPQTPNPKPQALNPKP